MIGDWAASQEIYLLCRIRLRYLSEIEHCSLTAVPCSLFTVRCSLTTAFSFDVLDLFAGLFDFGFHGQAQFGNVGSPAADPGGLGEQGVGFAVHFLEEIGRAHV